MQDTKQYGSNAMFTSGALTATGGVTTYDTTVTLTGRINGKIVTKTAITSGVTPLVDAVTGVAFRTLTANQGTVLVWSIDAAGTVKVQEGSREALDAAGNFINRPQFPAIPDAYVPFAYQVLKAGSTAGTITIGSSNWNATGFTNAIVNISCLPDRPQVS
jgi:hypothetical protein